MYAPYVIDGSDEVIWDERAKKLWSEYVNEEVLDYQRIRNLRTENLVRLAAEGSVMHVEKVHEVMCLVDCFPPNIGKSEKKPGYHCVYRVLNGDRFYGGRMFMAMLVCAEDEKSREELQRLGKTDEGGMLPQIKDYYDEDPERIRRIFELREMTVTVTDGHTLVEFDRLMGDDEIEKQFFSGDKTFYILERYKDVNSTKIKNVLLKESDAKKSGVGRAYLYPADYYKDLEKVFDEKMSELGPEDGRSFTRSQEKAFRQLYRKNITLLIGPPGTGKTDFIARAVITLCRYYHLLGKRMSVLVSANSHSAINNILAALAEKESGKQGEPKLFKLEKWGDDGEDAIEGVSLARNYGSGEEGIIKSCDVYSFRQSDTFVMGSTCWQILKSIEQYNERYVPGKSNQRRDAPDCHFAGFDLVIIDEASQVRLMDSLLNLHASLDNPGTRFLIVGDDDQLPPIIQGKYEPEGNVYIYGSAFRFFLDCAKEYALDYVMRLEEQFRMNEILVRYSGSEIYDRDITSDSLECRLNDRGGYHAYDYGRNDVTVPDGSGSIANQKLFFADEDQSVQEEYENSMELIRCILDPRYPMVVCSIHGGAGVQKQKTEIGIISDLIKYMRSYMIDPATITAESNGRVYPEGEDGDKRFWGSGSIDGGVGIVSPHHVQIKKLKDAIYLNTGMDYDNLYVGTVDKLQGRQREAVIVSYGVSDPEKAVREREFIFSRNRLNVALTRGKKKMICFLSDTLTDYGMDLSDKEEDVSKGAGFMTGLIAFMQTEEEDTECSASKEWKMGDVCVTVYRKRVAG